MSDGLIVVLGLACYGAALAFVAWLALHTH